MSQFLYVLAGIIFIGSLLVLGFTYVDAWVDRRLEEAWRSDKFLTDNDRDAIQ